MDWWASVGLPLLSALIGAGASYAAVARQTTQLLSGEREHLAETFRQQRQLADEAATADRQRAREAVSVAAALDTLEALFAFQDILPMVDRTIPLEDDRRVRDALAGIRRSHYVLRPKLTSADPRRRLAELYDVVSALPAAWNRAMPRTDRMRIDAEFAAYCDFVHQSLTCYLDGLPPPAPVPIPTLHAP